ncbi:chloride channel protein [Deferribacterales bacterium Es71-Z0220]|uniref:chloride channel protein n=1 Tax=Deferrivibrio essentukiensis TaxID=2880922 RepID=UPI001F612DA1|nr:chloride channel protein [Deferrivibrio essentukiensis]MCB4203894.1 chloride channel protein [Deferrivibrio essentukiensis]
MNLKIVTGFIEEHEEIKISFVAVLIGLAAGYGNILFRYLIGLVQNLSYGSKDEFILYLLKTEPFYKVLFIPALGGLTVGLIGLIFKSAKGHGVPDVIKAIALNKKISSSVALIKTVSSAITLGTGGSAGREGPIVQIGASIGSGIGRLFKYSTERMKGAIACGAAGGLAATFNAPIGGAMFAAEVLLGEFGLKTFSPIIISSVIATTVSRAYLGNHVTFEAPTYMLKSFMELPLYAILGVVCAFVGVAFIRIFYKFEDYFEELNIPRFVKPALGGLLMGVIAIFSREIIGVGYDTIHEILISERVGVILLIILVLKILATSFTLGSGGSGGLFVPSLFLGAATGGFMGWLFNLLFPNITAFSGAYGLVAMSAMLAATIRAPLTSILIIFEITQNYQIILPLMLSAIIANVVANFLEKESIFTWILKKQGINIKRGAEESVLKSILVKDIMEKDILTFHEDTPFREIKEGFKKARNNYFPVLDAEDNLVGIISIEDIRSVLFEEGIEDIVVAGEISTKSDLVYLMPDENLAQALKKFNKKDLGALPVVEKQKNGKLKFLGLLRRNDIAYAYNRAVAEVNL